MDLGTIGIIVVVVALIALFIYNRSRPAPHGTYDDKKVSSSGSIGGGTRAHDDESVRSSGSIGGGAGNRGGGVRAYDSESTTSGGTIGGSSQAERRNRAGAGQSSRINDDINDDRDDDDNDGVAQPSKNDRDHRSTGSFGGSGS